MCNQDHCLTLVAHLVLCCLGPLVLISGCKDPGPATYVVTGTVTYKGKPLPTGLVTFESVSYRSVASPIDSEGRYRLETIEGEHEYEPISPGRFNYPGSSDIKVTVEQTSENKIDIKLE